MTPLIRGLTLRSLLYYLAIASITLAITLYALFQARFILSGPVVIFANVPETVQTERIIMLEGTAENIVRITLNGREIFTDKDGYFKEALILENGYTIATIEAHDRYGRSRDYTHEFVFTASSTETTN